MSRSFLGIIVVFTPIFLFLHLASVRLIFGLRLIFLCRGYLLLHHIRLLAFLVFLGLFLSFPSQIVLGNYVFKNVSLHGGVRWRDVVTIGKERMPISPNLPKAPQNFRPVPNRGFTQDFPRTQLDVQFYKRIEYRQE